MVPSPTATLTTAILAVAGFFAGPVVWKEASLSKLDLSHIVQGSSESLPLHAPPLYTGEQGSVVASSTAKAEVEDSSESAQLENGGESSLHNDQNSNHHQQEFSASSPTAAASLSLESDQLHRESPSSRDLKDESHSNLNSMPTEAAADKTADIMDITSLKERVISLGDDLVGQLPVSLQRLVPRYSRTRGGLLVAMALLLDVVVFLVAYTSRCCRREKQTDYILVQDEGETAAEEEPEKDCQSGTSNEEASCSKGGLADSVGISSLPTPARSGDNLEEVQPLNGGGNSLQAGECLTATFKPGPLGISAYWETGVIADVDDGGQAQQKGVKKGMKFKTVDGQPYTETLLDQKRAGHEDFGIVFAEVPSR